MLLRYIYCEDLEIKEEFARDLYELSDRWLINDLNADCEAFFQQDITIENFGLLAELAEKMGNEELLESATEYGLRHCGQLEENHLEGLSSSVLKRMICKCQRVELRKKKKNVNFKSDEEGNLCLL